MMNLVLDLDLAQVPVQAPLAAAVSQGAATQEVAQTLAASRIQRQKNPRKRLTLQTSQTLMALRYNIISC